MGCVVRSVALSHRMEGDVAGDDVVHERSALSPLQECIRRKQDVVVDEAGAVGYFGPDVSMVIVEEYVA